MTTVKLAQDRGQHGRHGQPRERDAHLAGLTVGEGPQISRQGREAAEVGLDTLEEQAPGGREFGAAAGAVEEIGAEGRFELGEGATEGRLSDGEGFGGFAKMQLAGQLAEINEVT
jgi:hypothetical protein